MSKILKVTGKFDFSEWGFSFESVKRQSSTEIQVYAFLAKNESGEPVTSGRSHTPPGCRPLPVGGAVASQPVPFVLRQASSAPLGNLLLNL